MIVVDTCVLIDVIDADPQWSEWSREQLDRWSARGPLIINPVIFAEVSVGFETIEQTESFLRAADLHLRATPPEALFLAGKAWALYRRRGGARHGVLPDFFIGAHAAVLGVPLLTRDVGRYQGYFKTVQLIVPTTANP